MGGGPPKDFLLAILPFSEPQPILSKLRSRFPEIEIAYFDTSSSPQATYAELQDKVPRELWQRATILVTLFTFPEKVEDAPKLELVHLVSAGSNQMSETPIYKDSEEIVITTSSGIHGPQIAEWVLMTGLVGSHGYRQLYELQKRKQWGSNIDDGSQKKQKQKQKQDYRNVRDWVGRRIGILGYGSIGRQVGRVAHAMGMEVFAYTATAKDTQEKKKDRGYIVPGTGDAEGEIPREWYSGLAREDLRKFLQQDLDWLAVSVPLTKETRHFLSHAEFDVLSAGGKRPAFVTNIARGAILDQPALIDALKDGRLSGAALDVTDPEPLPRESELWELENVILTPHVSGIGSDYVDRTFEVLEGNLERRRKGEGLINVVNRRRGY
ncbi:D-2-hydroxyacid dehydrogenase [Lecanosticta acicola]|uniref:D-2-hydroxyacid dehydrogenase n=1 Tax=Lecanosticta acicola TaxID=111012 RepID=A0AAI9EE43_9PEZI|nr:D-2-hydroxyacid dehydrogenase [Lecanosticta acicola]